MQYFRPETFWGRVAKPQCVADSRCEATVGLSMIGLALALVIVDLVAASNVVVVAVEPLLMAFGGWILSRKWSHRLLAAITVGFTGLILSGDEHATTVAIIFAVTCLLGLTSFELSDTVNQRRRFLGYLEDQLRTPVTLIRGYVSMAKEGDVPPEIALAQVDKAAEMLGRMVEVALYRGKRLAGQQAAPAPVERLARLRLRRSAQHYEVVWHGIGHKTDRVLPGGERGGRAKARDQEPVEQRAVS